MRFFVSIMPQRNRRSGRSPGSQDGLECRKGISGAIDNPEKDQYAEANNRGHDLVAGQRRPQYPHGNKRRPRAEGQIAAARGSGSGSRKGNRSNG